VAVSSAPFERSSFEREVVDRAAGGLMRLRLARDFAMVGAARRALRRWLHERGCRTADDAMLVLSELVTNSMIHAGAGCTVEMQHGDDRLRLEVRDRSPNAPVIGVRGPLDVGGRGLRVVDAVTEAWGWEPTVDGKRVWAIVAAAVDRPGCDDRNSQSS
jgi:anti-sigma regulatory factor (Ser/Thr protein kinase)